MSERLESRYDESMPEQFTLDGRSFARIVIQRGGDSAVYQGEGEYLRLGSPERIAAFRARHELLASNGFPVASILRGGTLDGRDYYTEKALTEPKFGAAFRDEWEAGGVSTEMFASYIAITSAYTEAQLTSGPLLGANSSLYEGAHVDWLCAELPDDALRIRDAFKRVEERLAPYPVVACHGDYNPQNAFPDGVIDFEDMFSGPAGYDQATGITSLDFFPDGDFEYTARYRFSDTQKQAYWDAIDRVFTAHSLPAPSANSEDFAFCRAAWSAVRMHQWPKLQAWRYQTFRERFLDVLD